MDFLNELSKPYPDPMAFLQIVFSDGCGNCYIFKQQIEDDKHASFTYDPMRPEFSSSGCYSGGEMIDKLIEIGDFNGILEWFHGLRDSQAGKAESKTMGTGVVSVYKNGKLDFRCMLKHKSDLMIQTLEKLGSFK